MIWGLKLLIYFQLYENLLHWGKEFIYQFTALYGIILLLQLLKRLIELMNWSKVFVFYFVFVL